MAKVNVETDCGNAPKKLFIRDFMVAFANNDIAFILDCLTDDIHWDRIGGRSTADKSEVEDLVNNLLTDPVQEMTIETIITHGNAGSTNGSVRLTDGKGYGFCHVFIFGSHGKDAKIRTISSYLIKLAD